MANELSISNSATLTKNGVTTSLPGKASALVNVAGSPFVMQELAVAITDTTIPIPSGTLGYAFFLNLDPSIGISIRVAAAGTKIARLLPGDPPTQIRLDSGITAPVAIADSGSPLMLYAILPT